MAGRVNRIKGVMDIAGLSYDQLSNITGISRYVLQRYVTGAIDEVPAGAIARLADVLGVPAMYLIGRDILPDSEN